MTVQELINSLEKFENKDIEVMVYGDGKLEIVGFDDFPPTGEILQIVLMSK